MEGKEVPIELITEILCLIPVKSLRRFEMVSKSWCSLIRDRRFIACHLQQSAKTNSYSALVSLAGNADICLSGIDWSRKQILSLNFTMRVNKFEVRGSCNGLICLSIFYRNLIISNLSTKDYHITSIPSVKTSPKVQKFEPFYGFGFDSVNDDYKVLLIVPCQGEEDEYYAETTIYSLRSNAWSQTKVCIAVGEGQRFPCISRSISNHTPNGVVASGALHWLAMKSPYECFPTFILAFDLTTEEFHEMPLPHNVREELESQRENRHNFNDFVRVGVLEGCLCVSSRACMKQTCYDIWVMKDYSIRGSWTKLFRIISDLMLWTPLTPLVYSRSDHKLLLLAESNRCFLWYDLEKGQMKYVSTYKVSPPKHLYTAAICLETLVSLSAYKALWKKDANSRRKGRGRKRKRSTCGIDMQTQVDPRHGEFDVVLSFFFIFLKNFNYVQSKC